MMPTAKQTVQAKEEDNDSDEEMDDDDEHLEIVNDVNNGKELSESPDEREDSMVAVDCRGERIHQIPTIVNQPNDLEVPPARPETNAQDFDDESESGSDDQSHSSSAAAIPAPTA